MQLWSFVGPKTAGHSRSCQGRLNYNDHVIFFTLREFIHPKTKTKDQNSDEKNHIINNKLFLC